MRTLIVAEFISLDGVVEAPERWHMSYVDAEMFAVMWPQDGDVAPCCRTTYDSFAGRSRTAGGRPVVANMNGRRRSW